MPLDQQRAALLDAITQSPHQTLVLADPEGTLHQMLYTSWEGWHTGCDYVPPAPASSSWMTIDKLRYGKPSCLSCLAFDKPDPKEVGWSGRSLKLYSETKGQHVHVVMFTGDVNQTLANIGGFTVLTFEWRELRAALVLGCKALGIRIELEEADG